MVARGDSSLHCATFRMTGAGVCHSEGKEESKPLCHSEGSEESGELRDDCWERFFTPLRYVQNDRGGGYVIPRARRNLNFYVIPRAARNLGSCAMIAGGDSSLRCATFRMTWLGIDGFCLNRWIR